MKTRLLPGLLLACALAAPLAARAQQARQPQQLALPATAQAAAMTPAKGAQSFALNNTPNGAISVVKSDDPRFPDAIRAVTAKRPDQDYQIQIYAANEAPIKKGDVLFAQFWMRTIATTDETGQGSTAFVLERAGDPYTKSVTFPARAGDKWQQFQVPFAAAEDYAAGEANTIFRLGYGPQTIEIAGFSLANYGNTVTVRDFPRTKTSYAGQQPDAPWRREAAARIDKLRKADMTVRVVDADGKPIKGATVNVAMTEGAYRFGSAINAAKLFDPNIAAADKDKYRQVFRDNFGFAVMENGLKWKNWDRPDRRAEAFYVAGWLQGQGIPLRGHNLVWPSWRNSPGSLESLKDKPDELRRAVRDHILDEAGKMRGLVTEWDVVNEPFDNHDIMDVLGGDVMVDWFKAAREADPDARLTLNDYAILSGGTRDTDHQKDFESQIQRLLDGGAPLGGIGMQGHMGSNYTSPTQLWKVLDRYAKFGLPITVTEFDIDSDDEAAQADYMRDFLTAMFAHPATDGVMMWGFWEGSHWKPQAALWRRDWTLKPSGEEWLRLVKDEWTTRATGLSNAKGEASVRGFKGNYRVTATQGARAVTMNATLSKDGDGVTVVLG